MKKVNGVLRVTEADSLSVSLVGLFEENAGLSDDSFLASLFGEIKACSANLTTAIKRTKVSSSLDAADSVRDEAVRSLGNVLSGYASLPIASKKDAAEKLLEVYKKYGRNIVNANYASESSLIESLLEDLGAAELKDCIEALDGVAEIIKNLRDAESAFKTANSDYVRASAISSEQESAYAIKKSLLLLINDRLLPYLSTMVMVNAGKYAGFVRQVEIEIARTNETTAKRSKKA